MSKIAVLLPDDEMVNIANKIIQEENIKDVFWVQKIQTATCVSDARSAIEAGADIIIARGGQATYIKEFTNIPVAEVKFSAQELAIMIQKAKKMIQKEHPQIALIGTEKIFSNTDYFDELYDVELQVYTMVTMQESATMVEKAIANQVDIVIGGATVIEIAKKMNVPTMFFESREDSIREALFVAEKMSYTAEVERRYVAQFETILDFSFNGIIKIDLEKNITIVNRVIETLLETDINELIGKPIGSIFKDIDEKYLDDVLNGKRDTYTTSMNVRNEPLMATVAPICLDEIAVGAIISFYKMSNKPKRDPQLLKEMFLRGYISKHKFDDLYTKNVEMKQCVEQAKLFAISSNPIIIYGEHGTEKEVLAQCIHNNSAYQGGPFINVNCSGMTEEMQMLKLFGSLNESTVLEKGALVTGDRGTVLVSDVEKLSSACQYRLFRAIRYETFVQGDLGTNQVLDNRIIVTSTKNLNLCVQNGTVREDLFYILNGLMVEIPPLRERQDDIELLVTIYQEQFIKKYSKYITISTEAMDVLKLYPWPGNEIQLESFCERVFLSSTKRVIGEGMVMALLDELYPIIQVNDEMKAMVVYKHPEAEKITTLLVKYGGNRSKVAEEMNISTTTLWRYMKKYGLLKK